jgi:hypothetical protein
LIDGSGAALQGEGRPDIVSTAIANASVSVAPATAQAEQRIRLADR